MKTALITGITGQDGSYLAELLIEKGYMVHGLARRASAYNLTRIEHLVNAGKITIHLGDLSDSGYLQKLIQTTRPDEIYNLAAQSQVYLSFESPDYTTDINALGTLRLLEAIRTAEIKPKFFNAASSEIFGNAAEVPQKETTPLNAENPYGAAKLYAFNITKIYREKYQMFNCNGILYNHESPRRAENFVTKKITKAIANILAGTQKELCLGNIDDKRDWGFAKDYVEAMWLMLQQNTPDDYIIATGESYSVRDFLTEAFAVAGLDWQKYVKQDKSQMRPLSAKSLFLGDASKARKVLNWAPKVPFKQWVKLMVEDDLKQKGIKL